MDLFSLIFFLILYYVRPQEWSSTIASLKLVKISILLAIFSLLHRHSGLRWRDFFKTPHDWMMGLFLAWIVIASPTHWETFKEVYSLFIFYWVTVITLTSARRLQIFLNWWAVMIFVVAALAVASKYGYDPFGSNDRTEGMMKGRLVLNTSIFNNPNALGHSIVPLILMLYFIGIWNRPVFLRVAFPFLMLLPVYCIWLTKSKGAFLAGFATLINALSFKRPMAIQALIVAVSLTVGWVGVNKLPRMQELESAGRDQAIQGRVAAFNFGLNSMQNTTFGVGYGRFAVEFHKEHHYFKAAHSSYVNIGGELGRVGLFLFLGVLYCCLRTLFFAKTENVGEERVRRILFALLVSYMVSSWMVGWSNRGILFLMVGAIAAFHRLMLGADQPAEQKQTRPHIEFTPAPGIGRWQPARVVAPALAYASQLAVPVSAPSAKLEDTIIEVKSAAVRQPGILWNRITILDLLLMLAFMVATIRFWGYIMNKM